MDLARFEQLLSGAVPDTNDYSGFLSVVEALPDDLLWKLATSSPNLNYLLMQVVQTNLQRKMARQNVDNALSAITTKIMYL